MGGFAWINMSLNGLFNVLTDVGAYNHLISALKSSKSDAFSTIICDSAKPFLIGAIWRDTNHTLLVVCPRPEDARQLVTQLDVYFGEESPIFHFPELEVIPYERVTCLLYTSPSPRDS